MGLCGNEAMGEWRNRHVGEMAYTVMGNGLMGHKEHCKIEYKEQQSYEACGRVSKAAGIWSNAGFFKKLQEDISLKISF